MKAQELSYRNYFSLFTSIYSENTVVKF